VTKQATECDSASAYLGCEQDQLFSVCKALIDGLVDESSPVVACAQFDRASFGCISAWDWRSSPSAGGVKTRDGADGYRSLLRDTAHSKENAIGACKSTALP
jgi:hypothetical protein